MCELRATDLPAPLEPIASMNETSATLSLYKGNRVLSSPHKAMYARDRGRYFFS